MEIMCVIHNLKVAKAVDDVISVSYVYMYLCGGGKLLCGVSFNINHLNGDNICLMNNNNPTVIKPSLKKIINNMGLKRDNNIGNLVIIFDVEFPNKLTQEQIECHIF